MQRDRRKFLAGSAALGGLIASRTPGALAARRPSPAELDRAAARPVLKRQLFDKPVIIDSIRLLKKGDEHFVHVRSKDGAEGISLPNPPRADYLDKILKGLVIPFFIGKDARDLEALLWELYRTRDNYKLYGIALWCPQAWVEFAILDMLGRIAGKPMGALLGDIVRKDVAFYVASGKRDTTPEQEVENLQKLLQQSGARAVKFRVGGRMNRNVDAMPGRTETADPAGAQDAGRRHRPARRLQQLVRRAARPAGGQDAGRGEGGLLRGALPVRPPGGDQGGRRPAGASRWPAASRSTATGGSAG